MDKTCGICRGPHFTAECPNQQHISRGNTRVETNPSILTRQVPDKPRPPLVPPDRPKLVTKPVTPVTTSRDSVTECPRCVTLLRDATLLRNKIAALETELRCEQAKTRSKPPPLTPAERQRRRRERQANKIHPSPKHPVSV